MEEIKYMLLFNEDGDTARLPIIRYENFCQGIGNDWIMLYIAVFEEEFTDKKTVYYLNKRAVGGSSFLSKHYTIKPLPTGRSFVPTLIITQDLDGTILAIDDVAIISMDGYDFLGKLTVL